MAWTVDLDARTASRGGWVFKFAPCLDEQGAFDGECIACPQGLTPDEMAGAARIAREAGEAYLAAQAGGRRSD
jgi:hypothetical protein